MRQRMTSPSLRLLESSPYFNIDQIYVYFLFTTVEAYSALDSISYLTAIELCI